MLVHKSNLRGGVFPGFYVVIGLAAVLVLITGLMLSGVLSPTVPSVTPTTSSKVTNQQTYVNQQYKYSMSYPADWQIVDQGNQGTFTVASQTRPIRDNDSQGGTNFSQRKLLNGAPTAVSAGGFSKVDVIAYELTAPLTAQEFLLAKSSIAPEGKLSAIKVAGQDALRVEVQRATGRGAEAENLTYISVYVTSGNYGYIIGGFALPSVFQQIVTSFQTL